MSATTATSGGIRDEKIFTDYFKSSPVKKGVDILTDEAGDVSTLNNVAKFARRFFDFLVVFKPLAMMAPAGVFFVGLTDFFKAIGIFKSAKEAMTAHNIRKLASGILGVGVAGMAGIKLMDTFKWFSLAKLSLAMGTAAVPFSMAAGWVELVKFGVDISLEISNLIQQAKKIIRLNKKVRYWRGGLDETKCRDKVHSFRQEGAALKIDIASLDAQQKAAQAQFDACDQLFRDQQAKLQAKLTQQNKISQVFIKAYYKIIPTKVTRKARKAMKLNDKMITNLGEMRAQRDKIDAKISSWKSMKQHFKYTPGDAQQQQQIQNFCQKKIERLQLRKGNVHKAQIKSVLTIAMYVGLSGLIIAGTVLAFTGTGGLAVPIALMAGVSLAAATFGLGAHFYKKYAKDKKPTPIALPSLPRHPVTQGSSGSSPSSPPSSQARDDVDSDQKKGQKVVSGTRRPLPHRPAHASKTEEEDTNRLEKELIDHVEEFVVI